MTFLRYLKTITPSSKHDVSLPIAPDFNERVTIDLTKCSGIYRLRSPTSNHKSGGQESEGSRISIAYILHIIDMWFSYIISVFIQWIQVL